MSFDLWDVCGWIIVGTPRWNLMMQQLCDISGGGTLCQCPSKLSCEKPMEVPTSPDQRRLPHSPSCRNTRTSGPQMPASLQRVPAKDVVSFSRQEWNEGHTVIDTLPEITNSHLKMWCLENYISASFGEGRFLGAMLVVGKVTGIPIYSLYNCYPTVIWRELLEVPFQADPQGNKS